MENLNISGMNNVRLLNDLLTNSGLKLKNNLLRGDQMHNITRSGISELKDKYNVSMIIDFRTTNEINKKPDKDIPGVRYIRLPFFEKSVPGISHEDDKITISNLPGLANLYKSMLEGDNLKNLADILRFVLKSLKDNSILFHCTVGKDRTGILSALFLLLFNVDKKLILEDYLYTNVAYEKKAKKYGIMATIFNFSKKTGNKVRDAYLAKEEYINEVFKKVEKYEKTEDFFINEMKFTKDEIENYRKELFI